jgi:hypothetical protein
VFRELVACLVGVMLRVQLTRLVAVVLRVEMVGTGDVRVMGGLLMMPGGMGFGRCVVVLGGMLMMGCGVPVMLDLFLVGHVICC